MNTKQGQPWSFTIEFDETKAIRNGYDPETLYDYVSRNVEPLGNERIARGTWKAKANDEVESQCLAISMLSKAKWVMQNVKSMTAFEDDPEGFDCLEAIRSANPERVYA
jgi:hypothetical protein